MKLAAYRFLTKVVASCSGFGDYESEVFILTNKTAKEQRELFFGISYRFRRIINL
jgi:hypothetical protein